MKYNIRNRYRRFLQHIEYYTPLLVSSNSGNDNKDFIDKSGVINFIWNEWNILWRTIWLANISGGIDKKGNRITALLPHLTESEITYYLKNNKLGKSLNYTSEPTWGGLKEIQSIAGNLYTSHPSSPIHHFALQVSAASSLVPYSIEDFRIVRNASIHLSEYKIKEVKSSISARYVINNYKYPTDALNFKSIATSKKAMIEWKEEFQIFLDYI